MCILLRLLDILCMFLSKASRHLTFYYKFSPQIYDMKASYLKGFYFSYLQMTWDNPILSLHNTIIFTQCQGYFERGRGSELMADGYHADAMHVAFWLTWELAKINILNEVDIAVLRKKAQKFIPLSMLNL